MPLECSTVDVVVLLKSNAIISCKDYKIKSLNFEIPVQTFSNGNSIMENAKDRRKTKLSLTITKYYYKQSKFPPNSVRNTSGKRYCK